MLGEAPINLPETPPTSKSSRESSNDYITGVDGKTPPGIDDIIKGETPPPEDDMTSLAKGETPPPRDDIVSPTQGETPLNIPHSEYINAKVIVYSALSGMVSFLPDGTIHGCNHHFSLMLSGYSQEELLGKVCVCMFDDECFIGTHTKVYTIYIRSFMCMHITSIPSCFLL